MIKNLFFVILSSLMLVTPLQLQAETGKPAKAVVLPAVNINKADVSALSRSLVGVGPHKAKAIVAYRKLHGAFRSAEELSEVKGIGSATVKKNLARIKLK